MPSHQLWSKVQQETHHPFPPFDAQSLTPKDQLLGQVLEVGNGNESQPKEADAAAPQGWQMARAAAAPQYRWDTR